MTKIKRPNPPLTTEQADSLSGEELYLWADHLLADGSYETDEHVTKDGVHWRIKAYARVLAPHRILAWCYDADDPSAISLPGAHPGVSDCEIVNEWDAEYVAAIHGTTQEQLLQWELERRGGMWSQPKDAER